MVFQMETQVDVAATPGPSPQNQLPPRERGQQGARGARLANSFLGIAGAFGALKSQPTRPNKLSTARMDPFSLSPHPVGDYNSIMSTAFATTAAEYHTRLSHASG